ncbi:MAG TPA: hypothetical protein VJ600_02270 [Holophagaceae bacterium]|nr:hypothetical protein [Holophagaceae bacterium]
MGTAALVVAILAMVVSTGCVVGVYLELRGLSKAVGGFLDRTDRNLGSMADDVRVARMAWERLSENLEEATEPLARLGKAARRLEEDLQGLRERYRTSLDAAARQAGWAMGALQAFKRWIHPEAAVGAASDQGDLP